MSKYVVNFGDSWAHAADIDQRREHGYANVVAKELGYNLLDYSIPSTGIARMVLQFQNFVEQEYNSDNEYIALFFVTAVERLTLFRDQQPFDIWPQSFEDFYSQWYSDQLGEYNANTSLITLQTMCRLRNIQDVYVLGWQNPMLWPEIDKTKFVDNAKSCVAQQFGGQGINPLYDLISKKDSTYLIPNNWHPNINGHKFIANAILQHLKLR